MRGGVTVKFELFKLSRTDATLLSPRSVDWWSLGYAL